MKHKVIFGRGKRKDNQDDLFPKSNTENNKIFVVCDGVGGAPYGKEAAQITSEAVHTYLTKTQDFSAEGVKGAIDFAEQGLDIFKQNKINAHKMSTTLSLLLFTGSSVIGAWVGDSRIYHVRNKEIIYKSEDHSLGKMLVSKGLLSASSAKHFPHKNVITRGISGSSEKTKADIVEIKDIAPHDYFMVCTDGFHNVLQKQIIDLFHPEQNFNMLGTELKKRCFIHSSDNYACHLIKIP